MLCLFFANGIILFLIALPLYLQKVPPNLAYGFRIRKTLENPALWYAVNRYSAGWMMLSGLLCSLVALVFYFIPGLAVDTYALSCLAMFVISFSVGMFYTIRYMNSLPKD
jgi:uncharacterized membrane protein